MACWQQLLFFFNVYIQFVEEQTALTCQDMLSFSFLQYRKGEVFHYRVT